MGTYSTGMKQRVKLAQALVHDPVLAFLDEPTAGLDPLGRRDMLELIRRVGREFGISIVISTHLMGDVERTCDAVVVLGAGKVLRSGQVAGLTEETETVLVDLVEGAAALAEALAARGLTARLDGNRLTLEQRDRRGLRRAARRDRRERRAALPARARAALARRASSTRPSPEAERVTEARAEIFDLGYHGYEGERTSRWRRRRAIWRDGVRISLGLGRGTGAKLAPWLLIALALAPMAVLVVLAAFLGSVPSDSDDFSLPTYAEYYEFAIVPLVLFAAVVAPLLLCPDRRDGVLSLYAARPITPTDYVASRWSAFLTVSAVVVWLPEAVLFVWNLLDASDTGSWIGDNWDIVPRFLASRARARRRRLTTLALLVSSFTTRRAYAAIGMLAVLFIGGALGGIARGQLHRRRSPTCSRSPT